MISVIVPVYNVEPYLQQCVESILNQTYRSIEVLLIDDGSPDRCGLICEELAKADDRVKVIHTDNKGLAEARNLGIRETHSEYIAFVDSDDWLEPDMFELLLKALEQTNSDISECGFWIDSSYNSTSSYKSNAIYQNDEIITALIDGKIANVVWNKLYRKTVFENVFFPQGMFFEDVAVMHRIIDKSQRVVIISDPKYHYRQRDDSILRTRTAKNLIDCVEAVMNRYNYIYSEYPELFSEKKIVLLRLVAISISRVWRWWHGCNQYEKQRYNKKIKELKCFSQKEFPLFGYSSWPKYLRFSTFFMNNDSDVCFAFLFGISQLYRATHAIFCRHRLKWEGRPLFKGN